VKHRRRWTVGALLVVPLLLTACGGTAAEETATKPAVVERVKGTNVKRVTLTAKAAQRLDIQTATVRSDGPGTHRTVIPSAAVLYDPNGATWAYTSPERLVFVRQNISVDRIDGHSAVLTKGPAVGTAVVTVGSTELWGVEYGGIEED
jgi:hypothetical protein